MKLDTDLIEQYFKLITSFDVFENHVFKNNTVPTLLALGLFDYSNPAYAWLDNQKELKNVHYNIFSNSAHFPMMEEPDEFDRVVQEFLVNNQLIESNEKTLRQ